MRNAVVVDTSLAIKWILEEPDSDKADTLLVEWSKKRKVILVPALLIYEITNALFQNVRKGEITVERAKEALAQLLRKKLKVEFPRTPDLSIRAIELTHRFSLEATYDPHFLALAEREGCELWTADKRMWRVVKDQLSWVHWLGNYSAP